MKKGAFILSIEILQSIPKLIAISLVVFVVYAAFQIYINRDRNVTDIESHILAERFFYSKDCALYSDGVRAYPGVIDLSRFNENTLSSCYANDDISFKFSLRGLDKKIIKEVKVNDFSFDLCKVKNKNFNCYFNRQYVLYFENNIKKQGLIDTQIVIKK